MPSLVPLDAEGSSAFVQALRAAWDGGDAVLPVDPRLPASMRQDLLQVLRPEEPVDDGDALVVTTSGSTGVPKGVVLTHDALRSAALAVSRRLGVDPDGDRWLACLPLAHMGGLAVVVRALVTGTALDVHAGFDVDAVNTSAATLVSLVPTMLDRGVQADRFRAVLVGGGPDWRIRAPNVVHTYGMTETTGGIVHDGEPLEGVEVRLGEDDQVFVRGPMLLRCYRDGTDPKTPGGWLPTGDAGRLGPDGRLTITGRLSDVIITGGEKVWPHQVELVLRTHSEVKEVAVGRRPDPEWGQRVVAFVVPRRWDSPPTLASLRRKATKALPPWAAPKEVVLVEELPRTRSGKPVRL